MVFDPTYPVVNFLKLLRQNETWKYFNTVLVINQTTLFITLSPPSVQGQDDAWL